MATGATAAQLLEWLPRRPSRWGRVGRGAGAGAEMAPTTRETARRCSPLPTGSAGAAAVEAPGHPQGPWQRRHWPRIKPDRSRNQASSREATGVQPQDRHSSGRVNARHQRARCGGRAASGRLGIRDAALGPHPPCTTPALQLNPVFFTEAGVTPTRGRPAGVTDTKTCRRDPVELPTSIRLFLTLSRKTPPSQHTAEENQRQERQKTR